MIENFNIERLNSFFLFGYYIDYTNPNLKFDFSRINKEKFLCFSEQDLIEKGSELWDAAINKSFQNKQTSVVPLSGGLDSRAILGGLLECTDARNINTYTFGTPGTLDYNIGNYIAKKVGTRHTSYPLTKHLFTLEEELQFSKMTNHQTVLFHHPPITEIINSFSNNKVWSGFMGDPLTGSHLSINSSITFDEAISRFINKNIFSKTINVHTDSDISSPIKHYLSTQTNDYDEKLSFDDWLDFNYRQLKYVEPHVLMKGFKYITPFTDKNLFSFFLSLSDEYRYSQRLYKKILISKYPRLFSYKTKINCGLSLHTNKHLLLAHKLLKYYKKHSRYFIDPDTNYIDFNEGIRNRNDIKKIIYENVMDLKERKILELFNYDEIWKNHINKKGNYADVLIVLASLEIHLKAGSRPY